MADKAAGVSNINGIMGWQDDYFPNDYGGPGYRGEYQHGSVPGAEGVGASPLLDERLARGKEEEPTLG